ncbi:MAG TPA: DMT family protein [Chitinophagaceae bacterium]|nr:DMT family protein [Chitinophagaceae bacterium]
MRTIILLVASDVFITFAWYYHLKQKSWPLWKAII